MSFNDVDTHPYSKLKLSDFDTNRALSRHRWFEFKEGFSAELVRLAVADFGLRRKPSILDTFAGSGTSLVEAGRMGLAATGIEVNPFLGFAARAKVAPSIHRQSLYRAALERILEKGPKEVKSPLEGQSTFTEGPHATKWLFNRSVLRGFSALQQSISEVGRARGPFKLALLAALLECSNAKRDGKCLRYKRGWADSGLSSDELRAAFQKRALTVIEDLCDGDFDHRAIKIVNGDCRSALLKLDGGSHDLLITSPPYLNSFDYSDVYRPELFAAGFVGTNQELRRIRKKTLCSHVQVKRRYTEAICSPLLGPVVEEMSRRTLWNRDLPAMVKTYFSDLAQVLERARIVLRRGGKAWIVVSTSAYAGVEIPVDLILADVATTVGWKLCGIYVLRQLRSAGQHWVKIGRGARPSLRESLIILDR